MTDAERRIWSLVRNRQLAGYKFRRQHPIGPFIADFVCIERRLIVELDSGQPSRIARSQAIVTRRFVSGGMTATMALVARAARQHDDPAKPAGDHDGQGAVTPVLGTRSGGAESYAARTRGPLTPPLPQLRWWRGEMVTVHGA
jgi:hypothetical protein